MEEKRISKAVISRLPRYYRYLGELLEDGVERISSSDLSIKMKVTASQIRQDLNNFGGFGQQGLIIIGAGHLGNAIANYANFERSGFIISALFDVKPELFGKTIRGAKIYNLDDLEAYLKEEEIDIAALTVPKDEARAISRRLTDAGIKAIWNFAHTDLAVTAGVVVENVHLSESLMRLSYKVKSAKEDECDI